MKRFLAVVAVAVLAAACGPKKPNWIMKGSGAFKENQKALYGVGVAEGIRSEALRRETADNRAIAQVSKQLSVLSTTLMRDYLSNTSVPTEKKANEEQYVENTAKTFTSNVISGVKIMDRYQDKNGNLYSLATLNLDDLKRLADETAALSQEVRNHIKANAEAAFDKLAQEEAAHAAP